MNFRQVGVKTLALLRREESLLRPQRVLGFFVHCQIGVGDAGIRQCEIRVVMQSVLEELHRCLQRLGAPIAMHGITSLQVRIVRGDVLGRMAARASHFFGCRLQRQGSDQFAINPGVDQMTRCRNL